MSQVLPLPKRVAFPFALVLALAVLGTGATGALAADQAGELYTVTNSPAGNAVKVFDRAGNGSLTAAGEFATGGSGTGGGLGNQSAVVLEIPVPEKEVADVRPGAPVRFKARSLPSRTFEGEVLDLAPAATAGARQRTVLARTRIDNREGLLRAGGTGFAKIYCGDRRLGALLLRRGARVLRTEFWALW